jgi:hypothetical protein
VVTDYAGPLWFPAPIAARVRCLESVYSWLRPFQIIEELSLDGDLGGWGYIDRAITALRHDLGCAAPAPEPEQVRAWQRRETRERNRIAA